ncbi:hypothetical protein ACKWTF_004683 [Chironomus riparius]
MGIESKLIDPVPFWSRKRYLIALLTFFGFFNVYTLRVNLSVAIVSMTEIRNVTLSDGTFIQQQDFNWDSKQKGLVLSSFFYGYITTQFIGGYLSLKYGGNVIFGCGIGVTALLTLITPFAASISIYALVAVRIIEGVFEGMTFPACFHVWSKWAPPMERSRIMGFSMAGLYVGTVVGMPFSGILASTLGWQSIFYVFGAIGVVWFILWLRIVRKSPADDPRLSIAERDYIMTSLGDDLNKNEKIDVPWMKIFTSGSIWAIIIAHFCEAWGFFTMFTQLPTFLKDMLNFDLTSSAVLSGIPYLALSICVCCSGYLADWFQMKGILSTRNVRRIFCCGSFAIQACLMILVAFVIDKFYSVLILTFAVGAGAFSLSGYAVNHLDIAPKYASIIWGISNTLGSVPGIVSPLLAGYIVTTPTEAEWQIIFYITAGFYLIGSIVYWFLCSGTLRTWAKQESIEMN